MAGPEPQPPSAQPTRAVTPTIGTIPHQPRVMNISGYSPYSVITKLWCWVASSATSPHTTSQ